MTNVLRRTATAAGVLAAGAAATLAFTGTASAAYFPFSSCYRTDYTNSTGSVQALYNHYDSRANLNFYLLYVYGYLPNPNNIHDSANWASCVPS